MADSDRENEVAQGARDALREGRRTEGAESSDGAARTQLAAPARSRLQSRWAGVVPNPIFLPVVLIGGMVQLAARVLREMLRLDYWGRARDEMYYVVKVAWFPVMLAVFAFGLMVGILGLNFTSLLGANNQYGQYTFIFTIREYTPWINSMVVAGIIGAAMCADLGARKVREELDALEVLGIDPIRELVLPRVVSVTILTPLLMVVSLLISMIGGLIMVVTYGNVPAGNYFATLLDNLTVVELVVALLKSTIIGFVIGIVCSYMGLDVSGGAIGVGRAVNRAVVIAFALVFIVDMIVNLAAQGLFPQMQNVR